MGTIVLATFGMVFFLSVALVSVVGAALLLGTTASTFVEAFAVGPGKPSPESYRKN